MNTESATIGAIITIICVLPFIFMYMSKTKKRKAVLQTLKQFASKHDYTVSQYEVFDKIIIGLDAEKKGLFFIKNTIDSELEQFVDLNTVTSCYPNTALRTITVDGKKKSDVIDRVELCFESKSKDNLAPTLELYNEKDGTQLRTEILLGDKWSSTINAQLM